VRTLRSASDLVGTDRINTVFAKLGGPTRWPAEQPLISISNLALMSGAKRVLNTLLSAFDRTLRRYGMGGHLHSVINAAKEDGLSIPAQNSTQEMDGLYDFRESWQFEGLLSACKIYSV